jgi:hypothetical protein
VPIVILKSLRLFINRLDQSKGFILLSFICERWVSRETHLYFLQEKR